MVTFFCPGCAQYLKKRQAEEHPQYCGDTLSCIECRKEFCGTAQIRGHTDCHPANPDPQRRRAAAPPVAGAEPTPFNGLKNTARRIVKRSAQKRMAFSELKAELDAVLQREQLDVDSSDAVLREKLRRTKNLLLVGNLITYSAEDIAV